MVRTLRALKQDETTLVQSGRPVGVVQTHEWAPRVQQRQLQPGRGLGQLGGVPPAGSPRPGHVRADDGRLLDRHRHPGHPSRAPCSPSPPYAAIRSSAARLAGAITLAAGLGGLGGAQPLAVTMNDGVVICVDCDPRAIDRRIEHRYRDVEADSLDRALQATEARDRP
ncbi:Urocanate hydratase OS=Streptomyces albaduncus OX=68172 GN=hutU PE=3 SV=1 [Streptomyces griseoloalbus]